MLPSGRVLAPVVPLEASGLSSSELSPWSLSDDEEIRRRFESGPASSLRDDMDVVECFREWPAEVEKSAGYPNTWGIELTSSAMRREFC